MSILDKALNGLRGMANNMSYLEEGMEEGIKYANIPETVKKVETINIGGVDVKLVSDGNIPEGEVHFVDNMGRCIGKIMED